MARSTMYQVRLGEEEKKETFAVFHALYNKSYFSSQIAV